VSRLADKYMEWYELHRQPKTVEDVKMVFKKHIEPAMGGVVAEDLDRQHILNYQIKRRALVSGRTVNKETAYLSGCLRWAERNGLITVRTWKFEDLPHARPLPNVLSADEVRRIIDAMEEEPFYKAYFLCLYAIGLRMNEARMIKVKDVDRENLTVTVKQKGGRFKRLPIPATLLAAFDAIAPEGKYDGERYIFLNVHQDEPKPIGQVRKAIARACKRAGITSHVSPHTFRHSFATNLMGEGVNMEIISKLLGHAEVKTTAFYTHVAQGHLRGASKLISDRLEEGRKQ